MKRKPLLIITPCDEKRFEVLQRRSQLPFDTTGGQWREYSLQDAFLLRVFLSLITRESLSKVGAGVEEATAGENMIDGFSPSIELAQYIVGHELRNRSIWTVLQEIEPLFVGAVAFKEQPKSGGASYFRLARFMGQIGSFPAWVADQIAEGAKFDTAISLHKMILVDVTDSARHVLESAKALGLEEAVPPADLGLTDEGQATK